jgi:hypothetical protein
MGKVAAAATIAFALVGAAGVARAQEECPLGSTQKSEADQTWCEPTVCDLDTQCPTGSLCRPVPLCVEIGTLDQAPGTKTDAGQRLLVRQRCGADKSCPQRTTCSEKSRCISRAQAEKAGLLASAASEPPKREPEKKACGCRVPGVPGGERHGAALAIACAVVVAARRRARSVA